MSHGSIKELVMKNSANLTLGTVTFSTAFLKAQQTQNEMRCDIEVIAL